MSDPTVIEDPTAFRRATVVATRDAQVGLELEPIVKHLTLDKSRIYQGWPALRNRHTDYAAARAGGLSEPNINGGQSSEILGELFVKFFGTGIVGGTLAVSFIGAVPIEAAVTARGIVTERIVEDDRVKLVVSMWVEGADGTKLLIGSATGFAPEEGNGK